MPDSGSLAAVPQTSAFSRIQADVRAAGPGIRLDVTHELLRQIDKLEQENEVLATLQQTATAALSRATELEASSRGASQGQLCIKVREATSGRNFADEARWAPVGGHRVRIAAQARHHAASTSLQNGTSSIVWDETLSLALDEESMSSAADTLRLLVIRDDDQQLDSVQLLLSELLGQQVEHRTCEGSHGWVLRLSLQWVASRSRLLQRHIRAFEARLRRIRTELEWCHNQLKEVVPPDIMK
eukprot:TRINITY_DN50737_c0_g1_i1.p1 TRINITY_DN50737_c0_g1~~TRINITY_DN50737_c0_g1_i1.p1  ORF type:complete len:273 (-),score=44.56 TRINITY_DN50737_c0_g1_i1:158-883(-)